MADMPKTSVSDLVVDRATGQVGQVVRRRLGGVAVIERGSGVRCCVLEEQVRPATQGEQTPWMIEKLRR